MNGFAQLFRSILLAALCGGMPAFAADMTPGTGQDHDAATASAAKVTTAKPAAPAPKKAKAQPKANTATRGFTCSCMTKSGGGKVCMPVGCSPCAC